MLLGSYSIVYWLPFEILNRLVRWVLVLEREIMSYQLETFIEAFNRAWTDGKVQDMEPLLDEGVVFLSPDMETKVIGRTACLETIRAYAKNATTKSFEVKHNDIHTWNETAVITIDYVIAYEMGHIVYNELGKELWTLKKQAGKWVLIWRALIKSEPLA